MYEIFWCLVFFLVFPARKNVTRIAAVVLIVTCVLEVMQLSQPGFLQAIRSSYAGQALLGTTFVWWDFPHYVIGCFVGWVLMYWLSGKEK